MKISRCVKLDYGHVGCASDVTAMADAMCSGRRHSEIRIPDNWFAKTKPCPDDLKPYLEVGYSCLKGEQKIHFALCYSFPMASVLCFTTHTHTKLVHDHMQVYVNDLCSEKHS